MRNALVAVATLAAAPAQAPWSVADMSADLDEIEAAIAASWSYFDDHQTHFGVDVKALIAAAKGDLPAVQSADDAARVLRRLVAGLQDGHAWCRVPGATDGAQRRLPFAVVDCKEGAVVRAVVVAGNPSMPQLGDLLVSVGGVPVASLLAELELQASASTPGMRRGMAFGDLTLCRGERVDCVYERRDGSQHERDIETLPPGAPVPGYVAEENWSLRWPKPDVALLRITSFAVPRWEEWLKAKVEERDGFVAEARARIDAIVAELLAKQAHALIIDVRRNGGGTDLLGIHLAERLLAGTFSYFLLSAQHDGKWLPPGGLTYGKGDHARWLGPVVALIDAGCFSTTDNFLRCLDDLHPSVTFVGRPTGGGTGAPRSLVVTSRCKFEVGACTQRVYGPKGRLTEGRGTEPDIAVQWTRADVVAGTDPDLAAALAAIERTAAETDGKK
jgi:C-terminal processing protease CtpA/Prc